MGDNMKLKEKDLKLLQALRTNGRMPLTELSKRTKIPISTIFERLRKHKIDIIQKSTILLDFKKLGFNVRVHFICRVDKNRKEHLQEHLEKTPNINRLYRINNGFNYLCEAIFEDMQRAEQFMESLHEEYHVKKIESFYILDVIKEEGFFTR
jgi:Lrp/AsnC family transcriptional regulator, regulator for asnA, asnC and gidA